MNISTVSNTVRTFPKKAINTNTHAENKPNNVSFKGIFLESITDVGNEKEGIYPARFQKKDALLLNKIAQAYPNQDCFIRKGYGSKPRLEFREKPPEVQVFDATVFNQYRVEVDPNDKEYPCVPLIIDPDSDICRTIGIPDLNFIIGVPSSISTNPSLPYTVKAGFELHKKLMEKKYQIMDVIGRTDTVDLGGESVIEKARKAIEDVEVAVTRFLVDSAYAALMDKASARQIYESNYPKIQTRLDAERRLDLTTSLVEQSKLAHEDISKIDICEYAMRNYPDINENKDRIKKVTDYMRQQGITLENSEDIDV